ncbi:MAG: hypothetical protein CSA04_04520 [Bacteroidetes bacterium]|nr:MAG: hypothetical protein CSA04_04520 [Bacteroidota bacterium]
MGVDMVCSSPQRSVRALTLSEPSPWASWSFTLGGLHVKNWKETPSLESHLLTSGEIASSYQKSGAKASLDVRAGYELGALMILPAQVKKSCDRMHLKVGLGLGAEPGKMLLSGRTESQLFPGFIVHPDDPTKRREKNSSFFSPASVVFSYGYSYRVEEKIQGVFEMGLCGGRADFFIDQSLYELAGLDELYGVKKGRYFSASYNINFRYEVARDFGSHLRWKNTGVLNIRRPYVIYGDFWNQADFEMHNTLLIIAGKRIKTKIENVVKYDPMMDKSLQLRHLISVGVGN